MPGSGVNEQAFKSLSGIEVLQLTGYGVLMKMKALWAAGVVTHAEGCACANEEEVPDICVRMSGRKR